MLWFSITLRGWQIGEMYDGRYLDDFAKVPCILPGDAVK